MSDVLLGKIALLKIENARLTAALADAKSNISVGEWEALTGFREENERLRRELAAERARVGRLRKAFVAAEGALEDWCPQQDQRMEMYLRRWELQDGDLGEDQREEES